MNRIKGYRFYGDHSYYAILPALFLDIGLSDDKSEIFKIDIVWLRWCYCIVYMKIKTNE